MKKFFVPLRPEVFWREARGFNGSNLRISVREKWRERARSPGSYAVEDNILHLVDGRLDECLESSENEEGIVVLDAEYVKNAPFQKVLNVVIHESIHDAIFKSIRGKNKENELTAYWKYDSVKDFVEFWSEEDGSENSKSKNESTLGKIPRKVKGVLTKLLVLVIFILMRSILYTFSFS